MGTRQLTITDADRSVDYVLEVTFDLLAPERELGYAGGVEVNTVKCVEVVTWLGKRGISAYPGREDEVGLEAKLGAWCAEKYADEIEAGILGATAAASERGAA